MPVWVLWPEDTPPVAQSDAATSIGPLLKTEDTEDNGAMAAPVSAEPVTAGTDQPGDLSDFQFNAADIRFMVEGIYQNHNPDHIFKVENLFTKYVGREAAVYHQVCSKYGVLPDPAVPYQPLEEMGAEEMDTATSEEQGMPHQPLPSIPSQDDVLIPLDVSPSVHRFLNKVEGWDSAWKTKSGLDVLIALMNEGAEFGEIVVGPGHEDKVSETWKAIQACLAALSHDYTGRDILPMGAQVVIMDTNHPLFNKTRIIKNIRFMDPEFPYSVLISELTIRFNGEVRAFFFCTINIDVQGI